MPIYEYSCPACQASFESLIMRASDEREVACPTCGSRRVARQLSRPAATRSSRGGQASAGPAPGCGPIG